MSLWDGYPVFLCGQERDISDRGPEPTGEKLESTLCPRGESRCSQGPPSDLITLTVVRQRFPDSA